jgi:DNA polymerase-3 subunit beta
VSRTAVVKKAPAAATPAASVTAEASTLADALRFVSGVVESRTTSPVLQNCLLEAHADKLAITGTNLDIVLRAEVECGGKLEPTTVPCQRLAALIAALPGDAGVTLALKPDAGRLIVRSKRGRWVLPMLPATDFPVFEPPGEDAVRFALAADELRRLARRVAHAISDEPTCYYRVRACRHRYRWSSVGSGHE